MPSGGRPRGMKKQALGLLALSFVLFPPAIGSAKPTVARLAELALDAYNFTRVKSWKASDDYTVVSRSKRSDHNGFQALALLHKKTGELVISYTGTKATEHDSFDLLAD